MVLAITIVSMVFILLATWFSGLWNSVIVLVNILLAAMIATNWFEPLASLLEGEGSSYTYLLDFVCLWALFVGSYGMLRLITDIVSRTRVQFNVWLDRGLRTLTAAACALVFGAFLQFTLHTAPLPPNAFQENPNQVNFPGSPDRVWLGFVQNASRGALAASLNEPFSAEYDSRDLHQEDRELDSRVFDSRADFIYKYQNRRQDLANESGLRVDR
jgi:hypothetical protein